MVFTFFILSLINVSQIGAQTGSGKSSIILIFDASGSMWGKVKGKSKIEIAKEALAGVIKNIPQNTDVGLIVYGHRRKGDCKDVEQMIPLGPLDRNNLSSKIQGLSPKGRTPISLSIKTAAETLKTAEDETTILLVSDGKETCEGDPCKITRELKKAGIKFVMHVVGFDVSEEERVQLQCIADAGGGKYYTARDLAQFKMAVGNVTKPVKKEKKPASGEGKVWFEEKEPVVFVPAGTFKVRFEAAATFHKNAWLGIVPSDIPHGKESVNDQHNLAYDWINKRTQGTSELTAPSKEGKYDIRLHDSDNNGREVAHVSFEVKKQPGEITLEKTVFITAETIKFSFKAPPGTSPKAWVGTIPSEIPHGNENTNDKHDVNYVYLKGQQSGTLTIPAPSTPGRWDLRMNDTDANGNEIAYTSFIVEKAIGEIWLDKDKYKSGEIIKFHFNAPPGLSKKAWIGIIPSSIPHGSETENDRHDVNYVYMNGRESGTLTMPAPSKEGSWDLRMHDTDQNGNEIAYVSFTVEIAGGDVSVKTEKTEYMTGEVIQCQFTAFEGISKKAWIGLIPANIPHGNEDVNDEHDVDYKYIGGKASGTVTFMAPSKPGQWDLRMHDSSNKGNEIAHTSFKVTLNKGSLTLDKSVYAIGEKILLQYKIVAPVGRGAWVGMFPGSAPHGNDDQNDAHDIDYQYFAGKTSGTLNFKVPKQPGPYEFRMHDSGKKGNEIAVIKFTVK